MLERAFRLKPSSINLPERQASPDTCIFCIFQIIICLTLMTQITCIGPTVYFYSEVYISESGSGWKQPINCALQRGYPSPSGAFHAIPDSGFYWVCTTCWCYQHGTLCEQIQIPNMPVFSCKLVLQRHCDTVTECPIIPLFHNGTVFSISELMIVSQISHNNQFVTISVVTKTILICMTIMLWSHYPIITDTVVQTCRKRWRLGCVNPA